MLVLFFYITGFALLWYVLRKLSDREKDIISLIYNYLFTVPIYYSASLKGEELFADKLTVLLKCIVSAPSALAFSPDTDLIKDPFLIIMFYLMSLVTVRAAALLFFKRALNAFVCSLRTAFAKKIYILSGEKKAVKALSEDILKNEKHAAIVRWCEKEITDKEEAYIKGVYTQSGIELSGVLRKNKENRVVLLPDKKDGNFTNLKELEKASKEYSIHATALIDNRIARLGDVSFPGIDFYPLSKEETMVRSFILKHRPIDILKERAGYDTVNGFVIPNRAFSMTVVGSGEICTEFLLSVYENTGFITKEGDTLHVTVFSEDADTAGEDFNADYPGIIGCDISWIHTVPEDPGYRGALYESAKGSDLIFVSLPDPDETKDTVSRLALTFAAEGITDHGAIVAAAEGSSLDAEALIKNDPLVFFEDVSEGSYTYELLVKRSLDEDAERINQRYNSSSLRNESWDSLGTFTRASNRAVVEDIPNKRSLIGDTSALNGEKKKKLVMCLAWYEHSRWVRFHLARGWQPLAAEDLTAEERENYATKRPAAKRHICLVGWDELDGLPQRTPGLLKEYDINNVMELLEKLEKEKKEGEN